MTIRMSQVNKKIGRYLDPNRFDNRKKNVTLGIFRNVTSLQHLAQEWIFDGQGILYINLITVSKP